VKIRPREPADQAVAQALLVGPLALMAVNLLAAWPGQRAARLRTGQVLRTE
jgi:hypothetical protein